MTAPTRRSVLRSAAGLAVVGSAGCLGGNDRGRDDTKRDFLALAPHSGTERVVSLAVTHDGGRVRGGRFRVPTSTAVHLDDGFAWGTYEIWAKLHHDDPAYEQWQSWTWKPRSCAEGDHPNDDGYWTGTIRVSDPLLEFSHTECGTEFGGFGGGGNRPQAAGDRRIGDLNEGPPSETTEAES
ncbi:hypothetical protein [Halorussus ruber]|uniref:hypothetical protein n=1 Tax=Halorussus ruber TaxID=1126238 RepID=UPI001091AC0F|nr:hypothetical protein [Halorussus ruber]